MREAFVIPHLFIERPSFQFTSFMFNVCSPVLFGVGAGRTPDNLDSQPKHPRLSHVVPDHVRITKSENTYLSDSRWCTLTVESCQFLFANFFLDVQI